jgi:anti-anti-sigma factor
LANAFINIENNYPMNVQISSTNDYTVLSVYGRVDTITAASFEKEMLDVIEKGVSRIIVNCEGLEYISSSGLRVFLVAQKKMMSLGGVLKLSGLQAPIQEIFDISGFSQIFSIFPDVETAVAT